MLNKSFLIFAIIVGLSTNNKLAAQESSWQVSLEEAQAIALKHSEDVTLANIEIEKARQQVKQSLAELLPQVYGALSYTQYGKLPATLFPTTQQQQDNQINALIENQFAELGSPLPTPISQDPSQIPDEVPFQFGQKFNVNADITATQVVFNGVFLVGLKAANTFIEIVEQQKKLSQEEIYQNVRDSYIQAVLARENIEIISVNEANLSDLLDGTTAMYENGFVEKLDVDRLQLSLNNLKVRIDEAKNQLKLAETVLKFQMGIDVYDPIILTDSLDQFLAEIEYDIAETGNFTNRTELALFKAREKVNEYNVKRFKSLNYPSMTFFGSLGSTAQRESFSFFSTDQPWFNTRFFGFELIVPIWDSFKGKSQTQYARLDVQRIQAEEAKFKRSLDLQYERAKLDLVNARRMLEDAENNLELAQNIYDISKIKYEEGVGTSLELSDAERELFNSQANMLQAKYKLLTAKTDLDKALGNY